MLEDDSFSGLSDVQIQELDAFLKQGIFLIINNLDTQRAIQVLEMVIDKDFETRDDHYFWGFRDKLASIGEVNKEKGVSKYSKYYIFSNVRDAQSKIEKQDAVAKYIVVKIKGKIKQLKEILEDQTYPNLPHLPRDIFDYMSKSKFYGPQDAFNLRFLNRDMYRMHGGRRIAKEPILLKTLVQHRYVSYGRPDFVTSLLALHGNTLAAGYSAGGVMGIIRIWDTAVGSYQVLTRMRGYVPKKLIALSVDKLAIIYHNYNFEKKIHEEIVEIWNWKKTECIKTFTSRDYIVDGFISLDHDKCAIADVHGNIHVLDLGATGEANTNILKQAKDIPLNIHSLAYLSENCLAALYYDYDYDHYPARCNTTIAVWDWKKFTCIRSWKEQGKVAIFNVFPDRKILLFVVDNNVIKIWDFKKQILTPFLQGKSYIYNCKILSNQYLVALVGSGRVIKGWDLSTKECVFSLTFDDRKFDDFAVLSDGTIAVGSYHIWIYKPVNLYDFYRLPLNNMPSEILRQIFSNAAPADLVRYRSTCKRWQKIIDEHFSSKINRLANVATIRIDSDAKFLYIMREIVAGKEILLFVFKNKILMIDPISWENINTLNGGVLHFSHAVFCSDNLLAISSTNSLAITLLNLRTGEWKDIITHQEYGIKKIIKCFKNRCVSLGNDGSVVICNIDSCAVERTLEYPDRLVYDIEALSENAFVIVSNMDVKIIDFEGKEQVLELLRDREDYEDAPKLGLSRYESVTILPGNYVALVPEDKGRRKHRIDIYNTINLKYSHSLRQVDYEMSHPTVLSILPNGWLAVGYYKSVLVWDWSNAIFKYALYAEPSYEKKQAWSLPTEKHTGRRLDKKITSIVGTKDGRLFIGCSNRVEIFEMSNLQTHLNDKDKKPDQIIITV